MILKADSALNGQHRAADTAKYRLLNEWNATQVEYPKDACLHRLFEAQAERTPDAIAVEFEERHLTFRELEQRANQLAHHLQGLGIGPETIVGVYMERSLEMIVSLYGILKAGGAYVPMDPEYPHDRIAFMLEDTRVPVLLTQKHLSPDLPPSEAKILCLDAHWPIVEKEPTKRTISEVSAENLAYVIYTSGSTGKPKGVMNCHSGICNRLFWMQDEYNLTEADRVLQKTPFSFDVSVWEFFWPLLFGARLIVAKPGGHRDSNYLIRLINEKAITTLHFVPSMLQIFLDDPNAASCCSLKRVICSGEALTYELQERFFTTLDAELHNLYGPTEAAVDVTYWACERGTDLRFVPIGRPVANTQMYVLDANLQPVPVGEPGELHIGGIQVARGYLNRPELTAEKFIPDPFRSEPGTRLYKTGDLGCYLPNGAIKYLGRIDHQVKIRGIRIELGEIESVLEAHPAVKLAIVAVNEERAGDKRLVAYLVANPRQSISIPQLRAVLEKELPESMIPSVYIQIDEMPLSPNGKVDRRALPAPGNQRPQLDQAYIPPRNKLEHYLADLWCDILKIEKIGIYDRFFELGGNSLNAAQFINRLQTDLGENIYIVSVFEAPTIAEYADFVKRDYTEAIAPKMGKEEVHGDSTASGKTIDSENQKIDREAIFRMYACIPHLPPRNDDQEDRPNPSAIFILAPPRSGTTLLRVMLAGHPDLFAASELQLLGFNTLAERRNAYTGKFSLWLEGTIRAIMEMKGCSVDDAYGIMDQFERQNATTKQFYRALQDWIGDKILVDKSPSYVLDPATLQKAERDFDNPLYIHLVRHPYATVRSFLQYHMDQVLYLKRHEFRPRQLAELVWLVSHQNAVEFLQNIPSLRHCQILFEDLVKEPEKTMRCLCQKF
ncbi:MAG: amino acid adenylation domain-containing protein, partial [Desulfobacterales bacterium]